MNYYDFLKANLNNYLNSLPGVEEGDYDGLIVAHGDKADRFVYIGKANGVPEGHVRLMHIQTYILPYSKEVRETSNGWVSVEEWIVNNYDRFKEYLPDS